MSTTKHFSQKTATDFESVGRIIRWFSIIPVALLLLNHPEKTPWIIGLALLVICYNFSRYITAVTHHRILGHPVSIMLADGLFIMLLTLTVGTPATPYSGYIIFLMISAAYNLGIKGVLVVSGISITYLAILNFTPGLTPVHLIPLQQLVVFLFILIAVGWQAERLTHVDRTQRISLVKSMHDNEAERARLLALLNSVSDAVIVTNTSGRILRFNESASTLSHLTELNGVQFKKAFPLFVEQQTSRSPIDIFDKTFTDHRRDIILTPNDETSYKLDIQVTPIRDQHDTTTSYIVIAKDISKERELDEQRKEFISVISHELRTPITIMEADLSMALKNTQDLSPTATKFLSQAHEKSLYLGNIIKDIGVISQAENGNLPIETERVDPKEIIAGLLEDFRLQADQSGLAITSDVATDTPIVVTTKRHVQEILQNYIVNAIKYSKHGTVILGAKPGKSGSVVFSVSDDGIGISPQDQKNLFVKFYRVEDFRTRETGGTGLGLYLSYQLAKRLDGRVWVESKLDVGSTFYLEIPPESHLSSDAGDVTNAKVENLLSDI